MKRMTMVRSLLAAVVVLGLAACESAPQQDRSVGGAGVGSGTNSGVSTGTMGGVSTGALTREGAQQQFAAEVGDRVLFESDSYSLNSAASATLGKQAAWLKRNAQWRIVIEGHCDERGTREYNLALGDRRAATVRDYLVNQGIPAQRISVISYGKERPVAVGNTEASWAQNRRGVTVLQN